MEREAVVERGRRNFEGFFIMNKMPREEKSAIKTEEIKKTEKISLDSDQLCTAHIQSRTSKLISEHPHSAATLHGQGSPLRGVKRTGGGGYESPAKRKMNFNTLLQFWGGDGVTRNDNHGKANNDSCKMSPQTHSSAGDLDWANCRRLSGDSDGLNCEGGTS